MDILRTILLCLIGAIIGVLTFIFLSTHPWIIGSAKIKVFVFSTMLTMAGGIMIDWIFEKLH